MWAAADSLLFYGKKRQHVYLYLTCRHREVETWVAIPALISIQLPKGVKLENAIASFSARY